MERINFSHGDIIMLDGLYGCSHEDCGHQQWGISGRRFPKLSCGHQTDWKLLRRRIDVAF
jgi:hypothetical protein